MAVEAYIDPWGSVFFRLPDSMYVGTYTMYYIPRRGTDQLTLNQPTTMKVKILLSRIPVWL